MMASVIALLALTLTCWLLGQHVTERILSWRTERSAKNRAGEQQDDSGEIPQHSCPECGSLKTVIRTGGCTHLWHDGIPTTHNSQCHCRACRRQRSQAWERGKPGYQPFGIGKNRCDNCGDRCRKHIWTAGPGNHLPFSYALCDRCHTHQGDDNRMDWMGFDIVRG
jgi:hypothetical protein